MLLRQEFFIYFFLLKTSECSRIISKQHYYLSLLKEHPYSEIKCKKYKLLDSNHEAFRFEMPKISVCISYTY